MGEPNVPSTDRRGPSPTGTRQSGVAVQKLPTAVSEDLVVVRLRIAPRETGERIVRVTEALPDGVERAEVGFDPEHRSDWRFENGDVWFTAVLGTDPVETRYGVRNLDPGAVDALGDPPRVDAVVPVEPQDGVAPAPGD